MVLHAAAVLLVRVCLRMCAYSNPGYAAHRPFHTCPYSGAGNPFLFRMYTFLRCTSGRHHHTKLPYITRSILFPLGKVNMRAAWRLYCNWPWGMMPNPRRRCRGTPRVQNTSCSKNEYDAGDGPETVSTTGEQRWRSLYNLIASLPSCF